MNEVMSELEHKEVCFFFLGWAVGHDKYFEYGRRRLGIGVRRPEPFLHQQSEEVAISGH